MTLTAPALRLRPVPVLSREAISWRTMNPGVVEIRVVVANDGTEPTEPGDLVIEAAPLGAFVPFTPVTRVAVGALDPGERRRVTARVDRTRLPITFNPIAEMFKTIGNIGTGLTPDVIDLMAHSEWVGNIEVYFDRAPERAVEAHRALGLRVRAGTPISALFYLPPAGDRYSVEARCLDPEWDVRVTSILEGMNFLLVVPPARPGAAAEVVVEVMRLRDQRTIPVEFSFETVEGEGGRLGCIRV